MQDLKSQCQEINNWFIKNTFQYDIPYCLTAPYKHDKAFLSILSTKIGIVSPRRLLQSYKDIKLYYVDNDIIEHQTITITQQNIEISFDYASIEKVFNYNVQLQMNWYMLPQKNQRAHSLNIHNFISGSYRNYLFVPINESSSDIDYEIIEEFSLETQMKCNKCLKDMDLSDDSILDHLYYIPKTLSVHCIYAILAKPWEQTILEYFNLIIQHSSYTIEELKEYYSVEDNILSQSIGYFFYDHQFKAKTENINSILQLRSLQNQINQKRSPLAIFRQATTIQRIQYYSEDQIKFLEIKSKAAKFFSCKPKLEITHLQIQMMPVSNLYQYVFNVKQYDNFLKLPTFMLELEQQMIVSEFANSIGITPNEVVQRVISRASYNREDNYELFETLGDSILKFLATVTVSLGPQNTNENALSDLRSQIVNNLYLGNHLFKHQYFGLFNYVRSLNHQTKWLSPVLQNIHSNHVQPEPMKPCEAKILSGFIADIFESLIAAVFLDKQSLLDAYYFLLYLRHPVSYYPANPLFYPTKSIVIEFEMPIIHNYMTFKELSNQADPIPEKVKQQIKNNNLEFYDYVQESILEYKFKNKYILFESFNTQGKNMDIDLPLELYYTYLLKTQTASTRGQQMLELLGDAILEIFIMCNCFNQIHFKFTPTNLYKIKMILVSNSFLAKAAICYHINWFLPDRDNSIQEFIQNVNLDEKFTHYNGNFVRVPKVLSDTFEAIIGSLFMDGGWEPVLHFLKKVYLKFIPFVCTYLNEIDNHVIDRVYQYSAQKQSHMDMKSFRVENGQHCCEIRIENVIVGRYCHEHERVAKEKACESACKRLKI